MFVSSKDLIVKGEGAVTAHFQAGVPRPLRDSLIPQALAQGVRKVEAEPKKRTRKAAAE